MKKIQRIATELGLGLSLVFLFFLIPSIRDLFSVTFIMLIRQFLALSIALCLAIAPEALVNLGLKVAPKVTAILDIIFGRGNKNNNDKTE